jgi:hypothetical protein
MTIPNSSPLSFFHVIEPRLPEAIIGAPLDNEWKERT